VAVRLVIKIINSNISGQRNCGMFMSIIIVRMCLQIMLINRSEVPSCSRLYKVVSLTI
jgi:hypothetical protein